MSPWGMGSFQQPSSNSVTVVPDAPAEASIASAAQLESKSLEPNAADAPKNSEEAMAEVLKELQQIGAIDHAAQQQLMTDLREAKPENWSLIVKQFQSALAYREQVAAKESQSLAEQSNSTNMAQVSSSVYTPQKTLPSSSSTAPEEPKGTAALISDTAPLAQMLLKELSPESTYLPPPPFASSDSRQPTAIAIPKRRSIEQANYTPPAVTSKTSQQQLLDAVESLEQSAQDSPSSVEDVQQHMRLRLLHLLAGQESKALSPIPGASGAQQDYWSKQLFAISTYLDNKQQPDVKRRAAGSLMHLDGARASLAEIATLHVRNLLFVDSVDGFGAYQPHEETQFKPGEQVILYTEVENFRSESTKEGYRTLLSTSYEVIDQNGQRVDGAQFPDVEDLCKNQRRDFHMQYGVALPTRIYPGLYKLQLTITDQQSHKIGQTSIPFEIVE